MKFTLKNKEIAPMDIIIDFFASLYDLGYDFIKLLINFFAFQYDLVYDFIIFLRECIKWAFNMRSTKSVDFTTQVEKTMQVDNQSPFGM